MRFALWGFILLLLGGCSGGLSSQVREEAYPLTRFTELRGNVEPYRGKTVILGGELIETRNAPGSTTLLVLERALGMDRSPKGHAAAGGRFMVRFGEFLDPALFAPGRRVTVAGRVLGTETEPVGEAPYEYVLLEGREIHLWEHRPYTPYDPIHSPGYDPFHFLYHDRSPWVHRH